MKNLIILLILFPIWLGAQNISVKSFKLLERDLDARVVEPKKDQNGDRCAIIKIVTTEKGFVFDGDMNGIVTTVYKTGEYWVYLPWGSKKITIKHEKLGVLRNYIYPIPIKESTVYEMVLATGRVITTVVNNEIPMQWFTITSNPNGADVFIDNKLVGTTPFSKKMQISKYNYRIENYMYHNSVGAITLTEDKKEALNIEMKPNFGYAKITTTPENGAKIEIDQKPINGTTPFTTNKLLSGKHTVRVKKAMYNTKTVDFEITDGQTTNLSIPLDANFATITIQTTPSAAIYIDDEQKGTGTYTGRVMPGLHNIQAKKDKYSPDKKQMEFIAGETKTISLHPLAKTGTADIISTPFDAIIKINGKEYGTTPNTIKNLLIGDYTLTLTKQGYGTVTKIITIEENKTITVNETITIEENKTIAVNENIPVEENKTVMVNKTLHRGREITINSNPKGAILYIDGTEKGTTPYTEILSFANHAIKLINGKRIVQQIITVKQNGNNSWNIDVSEFGNYTETVASLNLEMVAVKGGTFKMGSNKSDDEKPIHTVTVPDFYVGKYEVTQKLWKIVMGSNPSYFKGDNLPVENVSWNDAQKFIKKLNKITGKNYRLPTEAEWEYAAGNGSNHTEYSWGNDCISNKKGGNVADETAKRTFSDWAIIDNYDDGYVYTAPVGKFYSNDLGLYDMTGNVWEWCSDRYSSSYYSISPQNNPHGPKSDSFYVYRGGGWHSRASICRVANRGGNSPSERRNNLGFRLAVSAF